MGGNLQLIMEPLISLIVAHGQIIGWARLRTPQRKLIGEGVLIDHEMWITRKPALKS
jgi:hypothetical protein